MAHALKFDMPRPSIGTMATARKTLTCLQHQSVVIAGKGPMHNQTHGKLANIFAPLVNGGLPIKALSASKKVETMNNVAGDKIRTGGRFSIKTLRATRRQRQTDKNASP